VSGEFEEPLDWSSHARMYVRWRTSRGDVVDYAVTLIATEAGEARTIRVYDGAHGVNEMHRYTRDHGKQPATVFHDGTLGEGLVAGQF
jgi:hypothetical protein